MSADAGPAGSAAGLPRPAPDVLRRRLTAHGLAGTPLGTGGGGPVAVARRLLATQAQDPRGFRLAIRARTRACTVADVDRALSDERSLLVTWLNRGTLHLVTREDYPLLQALGAPLQRVGGDARLVQAGIDRAAAEARRGAPVRARRRLAAGGPGGVRGGRRRPGPRLRRDRLSLPRRPRSGRAP